MTTDQQEATAPKRRRPRLHGEERDQVRAAVVKSYAKPKGSIRSAAAEVGRSFGLTRTLLLEAGVTLRGRSGSRAKQTEGTK